MSDCVSDFAIHSMAGMIGEGRLDVVKDAQHRLRRRERSSRPDNIDPLAKLAAKR
jgi:hypothetical protein